jgi:alpha-tubulin suppressor-like RCC1 family protein
VNAELGAIKGVEGATQITAGFNHMCALRAGRVLCWPPQDPVGHVEPPVAVAGLTDAVQISSGTHHTCAVLASKRIVCWGDPYVGALGNGSESPSDRPVPAKGITDAVEVAAGSGHTCARLSTGKIMCWGDNVRGALGTGGRGDKQLVPAEVQGIGDAVELAVGVAATCVRRATGAVACWGSNDRGVLGDATKLVRGTPQDVLGLADIEEITVGSSHACARTRGRVLCWGANRDGQLGDGTTIQRRRPVAVLGLADAIAISAEGQDHTCALRATGQVLCWGANNVFQLGHGSGPSRSRPQDVAGLDHAIAIAVGGDENCALRGDRTVICWSRLVPQDQRGFEFSASPLRVAFDP